MASTSTRGIFRSWPSFVNMSKMDSLDPDFRAMAFLLAERLPRRQQGE
jgi:hypothetical protein